MNEKQQISKIMSKFGKMAAGKSKKYSPEERERRSNLMKRVRQQMIEQRDDSTKRMQRNNAIYMTETPKSNTAVKLYESGEMSVSGEVADAIEESMRDSR